jgi:hypothetical protein
MPASTPMLKRTPPEVVVEAEADVVCAFALKVNAAKAKASAEIFNVLFMIINIKLLCVCLNTQQINTTIHKSFFILMSPLFNRLINNEIFFAKSSILLKNDDCSVLLAFKIRFSLLQKGRNALL